MRNRFIHDRTNDLEPADYRRGQEDDYGRPIASAPTNRYGIPVGEPRVGKRTLTERIFRRSSGEVRTGDAPSTAEHGFSGPARDLPYREEMERAFGRSLSHVKAYSGPDAREAAGALGARAYAVGDRIAFADSHPDRELVAHEVTHVVQQDGGAAVQTKSEVSAPSDAAEVEADHVASIVARGGSAVGQIGSLSSWRSIARKSEGSAKAAPSGDGLTFEQAYQKVGWAYIAAKRHQDYNKAATLLREVDGWLDEVASGKNLQDQLAGKVGAVEQATAIVGYATAALRTTLFVLRQGRDASRGQWKVTVSSFKAAKTWLVTLGGEVAFEQNKTLADIEDVTADAYKVHAAIASIPVVLAIGAYAAPVVVEELGMMGGTALLNASLASPLVATEIGLFAAGAVLTIAMSGGIDAYLAQLETDEGKAQLVQDLMVILEMVVAHQPGSPGPHAEDHPPPKGRLRVRAKVDEIDGDNVRLRVVDVQELPAAKAAPARRREPTAREAEAIEWAGKRAEATPAELRDPAFIEKEHREYVERQAEIDKVYAEIMAGDREPPPGVTRERLRAAMEGPETGERLPLTFPDEDTYHEFQADLRAVFESEGITDAVVQQVGSATKGFKGNPKKVFGPWSPASDADFAVFSGQALRQAMDVDAQVNPKVSMDGRYTVLRNEPEVGKGFYNTPLGAKLGDLADKWKPRLWPKMPAAEGMDFKLNLTTNPFTGATTVVDTRGGAQ